MPLINRIFFHEFLLKHYSHHIPPAKILKLFHRYAENMIKIGAGQTHLNLLSLKGWYDYRNVRFTRNKNPEGMIYHPFRVLKTGWNTLAIIISSLRDLKTASFWFRFVCPKDWCLFEKNTDYRVHFNLSLRIQGCQPLNSYFDLK